MFTPEGNTVYGASVEKGIWNTRVTRTDNLIGHVDEHNKQLFEKMIDYLLSQGIAVEIYMTPLAPALWDVQIPGKDTFFPELDEYLRNLAERKHLCVIGSYNPHKAGIQNSDFFDSRHMLIGRVSKYFNLKRSE